MLTFLYGPPGSGKTQHIIELIKEKVALGEKTYLLVPEQQVYTSECMLADLPPSSALSFEIISFSRLCEIVSSKYGGIIDVRSGTGTRNLIMWQTLRQLSGTLKQYHDVRSDSKFTSLALVTVDELHANSISPVQCDKIADRCKDQSLAEKLHDIAAIYSNFHLNMDKLIGESAIAYENRLVTLAELLSKHEFISGCNVFIDSFTSFTGEEHAVLECIISRAKNTWISFPCSKGDRSPHLDTVLDTIQRINAFVNESQGRIEKKDENCGEYRRSKSKELALIERNLWNFSLQKAEADTFDIESLKDVEMFECANEYEEMWLAALNVIKAHNSKIKFSEIAIITRDPENRKGIIDAVFGQMGIPYFYSEKTDLSSTAIARLVLSALRCVSHNFNQTDVITLLKTGILDVDARDIDLFEEYCYTWKINGKTFEADEWAMNANGYTDKETDRGNDIRVTANRVRSQIIPPLVELRKRLKKSENDTRENCRALYDYLESINLKDTLSSFAEKALAHGDIKEASEILRLYDFLVSILADISTILSDFPTTSDDLATAIEIMFRNTDIGSVPAINDYVTIGSAATLRVENIKVAILVGLCEGEFPKNYSDTGILTENDKKIIAKIGDSVVNSDDDNLPEEQKLTAKDRKVIEKFANGLGSREKNMTSDELFYVYRAMTKPSERLILSTCSSNISGRTLKPSSAWNRMFIIFPKAKAKSFKLERVRIALENDDDKKQKDISAPTTPRAATGGDTAEIIDPKFVRQIFGDRLFLSKTTVSTFAECPYKYWSEKVLNLRERKVHSISYSDSGTIVHYALEKFVKTIRKSDGTLEIPEDDDVIKIINSAVKDYVSQTNCPLPSTTMYNLSRLRDMSLVMAKNILDEFSDSSFRVVSLEQKISERSRGGLKPMEIRVNEDKPLPIVSFGGQIDRIDCFDGDRRYIRIVDYKTGKHRYSHEGVTTGEDIQLPAYLFTATLKENESFFGDGKEIYPASALFLSAEEKDGRVSSVRSGFMLNNQDVLTAASHSNKAVMQTGASRNFAKTVMTEEQMDGIQKTLRESIADKARDMYAGIAKRTPSESACEFCSMRSSCPSAYKKR